MKKKSNKIYTHSQKSKERTNVNSKKNVMVARDDDNMYLTPIIDSTVHNTLPQLLRDCTAQFEDAREKDIVLISGLVVLSGCFSACKGKYGLKTVRPNLNGFIIAPAASGKGVMTFAVLLAHKIQKDFLISNEAERLEYEAKVSATDKSQETFKKPRSRMIIIPGNSSSAAIYATLYDCNGVGIICETEADTLTGAIKQDWGNFSDILRKAFHHDTLSLNRKGYGSYIEIENPCLSTLLSGTPDQVPSLIKSPEDGLASRFIFYIYKRPIRWIDPTPCEDCPDLEELFLRKAELVAEIRTKLEDTKFTFSLSSEQFSMLNKQFEHEVEQIKNFEGEDAMSALARLGLICYRVAMVLSILRHNEKGLTNTKINCTEEDFKTSLYLASVFFDHAMVLYPILPQARYSNMLPRMRKLFSLLPAGEEFSRKVAVEVGETIGISERAVGDYLLKFAELKLIIRLKTGIYKKNDQS
jgi:hypothetical protein